MFTLPGCTSVSFALILAMLEITVHDFVVKMVARVYECMSPWLAEALERYPSYDAQVGQLLQRVWDSSARRPWPRVRQHDIMQVLWAKWAPNERNYCSW